MPLALARIPNERLLSGDRENPYAFDLGLGLLGLFIRKF